MSENTVKKRSVKDYLRIYIVGLIMGGADVVPGVSGGTMALSITNSQGMGHYNLFSNAADYNGEITVYLPYSGNFGMVMTTGDKVIYGRLSYSLRRRDDTVYFSIGKCFTPGDLNGDGFRDVILANSAGYAGAWLLGSGGTPDTVYSGLDNLKEGQTVAGCGDVNGDGVDDVIIRQGQYFGAWIISDGRAVEWMGLGTLTEGTQLETIGDYDGDGIDDLRQNVLETLINRRIASIENDDLAEMETNFQAGVDTLYNKCVSCGSTPSSKTPTDISNAIQSIHDNRYTEGYNTGVSDALDDASSKVDQIMDNIGSTTNNGEFCLSNEIDYDSFTYTQEGLYIYSDDANFDKDPKFGYCIDGRYCHVNMRWTYTGQYQAGHTAIAGFPFPMYAFTGWYDMGHTKVDDYGSYNYAPRLSLAGILSASSAQYNRWMHHTFTYRIKFS